MEICFLGGPLFRHSEYSFNVRNVITKRPTHSELCDYQDISILVVWINSILNETSFNFMGKRSRAHVIPFVCIHVHVRMKVRMCLRKQNIQLLR